MNPHYRDVRFLASPPPGGWPECFAIVTAWNPMDRKVSLHENAAAHVRLIAKVRRRSDLASILSFIRVDAVQTSGKKKPSLKLSFFHQSYPEGVQDKVWKLEVLHRTRHLLAARSLEQDYRVIVITRSTAYRPSPDDPLICPPGVGDEIELTPEDDAALERAWQRDPSETRVEKSKGDGAKG